MLTRNVLSLAAAASIVLTSAAIPPAAAQQGYQPCPTRTYPNLTFGSNAPSYSSGFANGECWCGVWTGITPQQAQQQGWFASCNNGQGVCNYAPGTRASNAVCRR